MLFFKKIRMKVGYVLFVTGRAFNGLLNSLFIFQQQHLITELSLLDSSARRGSPSGIGAILTFVARYCGILIRDAKGAN